MIAPQFLSRPVLALVAAASLLSACAVAPEMSNPATTLTEETRAMYAATVDNGIEVPAIEDKYLSEARKRQLVEYHAPHPAGTIVVDPGAKYLYHVQDGETAMRYLVAVGEQGRGFSGTATVAFQRDWPYWTPTKNMLRRDPETYGPVKNGLPGGLENPLGARALYLYRNGKDTLYRIHGTPSPWTVGHATSSGCIRMFNQDSIYLADQVSNGARVIVLPVSEAGKWTPGGIVTPDTTPDGTTEGTPVAEAPSTATDPAAREVALLDSNA
ncbi:hypothetical protein GCM10011415_18640 [Salipiger pallidus]|uniref:L,D-TPase catalytic domain-containing protein n=1 Tax=Salipiger pallidus TaxID=1775170 RepID=A0A8J3EG73_9RHOB|nr:L,D-transpeptidase [Salipiger pallidus]GGG71119.1 hypothetical protein GCM10011415_18640 [Salipiger pallidus]